MCSDTCRRLEETSIALGQLASGMAALNDLLPTLRSDRINGLPPGDRLTYVSTEMQLWRQADRAPPGKKWSYDTLTLKVKTATGNLYITRFLDNGSGKKRSYGHKDFTAPTLELLLSLVRAWVRPVHGEIWIGQRDGHPSQRAKSSAAKSSAPKV